MPKVNEAIYSRCSILDFDFVGDEIIDIKSARKTGMSVAAVTWGYSSSEGLEAHKPDALVNTVSELRALFEQRLAQDNT